MPAADPVQQYVLSRVTFDHAVRYVSHHDDAASFLSTSTHTAAFSPAGAVAAGAGARVLSHTQGLCLVSNARGDRVGEVGYVGAEFGAPILPAPWDALEGDLVLAAATNEEEDGEDGWDACAPMDGGTRRSGVHVVRRGVAPLGRRLRMCRRQAAQVSFS